MVTIEIVLETGVSKQEIKLEIVCETLCSQPYACQQGWYSKTCLKRSLKRKTKIGFQDQLSLNAGQKYCRMLQGEHCAILSTFIKLPFVIKTFVLSVFVWPLKTGFTVLFLKAYLQKFNR